MARRRTQWQADIHPVAREFNERRALLQKVQLWTGIFSLIFFIDIPIPPLPAMVSLRLFLFTFLPFVISWFLLNRTSVAGWPSPRRLQQVCMSNGGLLTHAVLLHHFDIPLERANQLLLHLYDKGYLEVANADNFDDVKEAPLADLIFHWRGVPGDNQNIPQPEAPQTTTANGGDRYMDADEVNRHLLGGRLHARGGLPTDR